MCVCVGSREEEATDEERATRYIEKKEAGLDNRRVLAIQSRVRAIVLGPFRTNIHYNPNIRQQSSDESEVAR